ncbi:sigma-54 interaction domain-containing protein [Anaerovorax odorimutans]|uniref:sigma-54 interaction domain-containing protein n=1 Tax=Anaerovorax odorimutans TaxID=109327 RepID=UPI0004039643|nr:sigma 54-interacting transcriptional regulator [Anaerovorax odorimutans]
MNLAIIQNTVMEVAEATTHVLGIETEIVDKNLEIIAGTGRYKEKLGTFEENGKISKDEFYGNILINGQAVILKSTENHPNYHAKEKELAEICCPIILDKQVIGIIALVAFNKKQQNILISNSKNLLLFLKKMASLIASKLAETQKSSELKAILESIHDGIIALDHDGIIMSCNKQSETLLMKNSENLIGKPINKIWSNFPFSEVINQGKLITDVEEIYIDESGNDMHFLITAMPINTEIGDKKVVVGSVISFQDVSDVRSRIYNMTQIENTTSFSEIIGQSKSISRVKLEAAQVAASQSTILITGESGTGKGFFARAIHNASKRKTAPFITINCGAIPDTLLESELFGYQPGAFTGASKTGKTGKFELANNGTIFLDEIGDFPLHLQVKLLHVLQKREVERIGGNKTIPINVRIIAATNKNLEEMIKNKEFREDLFFRLNVIPLHLPPLRERTGDISILLNYALNKFNKLIEKNILGFSPEVLNLLLNYSWPGNIRELENAVEYAVNIERELHVQLNSLPQRIKLNNSELHLTNYINEFKTAETQSLNVRTDLFQKGIIEDCLEKNGYSVEGKRKAAKLLEISESTLYRRIRELGIKSK